MQLLLHSDLTPEECQQRIMEGSNQATQFPFEMFAHFTSKPFVAGFNGQNFLLQRQGAFSWGYRPVLFGELIPDGEGSIIQGAFDYRASTKLGFFFIGILIPLFLGLSVILLVDGVTHPSSGNAKALTSSLQGIFAILVFSIVIFLSFYAFRGDKAVILEFLRDVIGATPIEPPPAIRDQSFPNLAAR